MWGMQIIEFTNLKITSFYSFFYVSLFYFIIYFFILFFSFFFFCNESDGGRFWIIGKRMFRPNQTL